MEMVELPFFKGPAYGVRTFPITKLLHGVEPQPL
jgi:hypothetical protein